MSAEPTERPHLSAAAAQRTVLAEQRVRAAIHQLDREGAEVNFAAVSERARVSRNFLYSHPDFRQEILTLRGDQHDASAIPVRQRASEASLRARLRAALDQLQDLRTEITALREELAIAHGRVRELEVAKRTRRAA